MQRNVPIPKRLPVFTPCRLTLWSVLTWVLSPDSLTCWPECQGVCDMNWKCMRRISPTQNLGTGSPFVLFLGHHEHLWGSTWKNLSGLSPPPASSLSLAFFSALPCKYDRPSSYLLASSLLPASLEWQIMTKEVEFQIRREDGEISSHTQKSVLVKQVTTI